MELLKLTLLTLILGISMGSARADDKKSNCTVQASDPVIRQFFHSKGYEVDDEEGDVKAEFEVTCEAVDQQKDKFSTSVIHQTTTKFELFNQYANKKVVYHNDSLSEKGGRVEKAFVVPCADTREMKAKLLEASEAALKDINCDGEEE